MGICGPTHDERSWTFDLDPGGVDPVLGHRAAAGGLLRPVPRLPARHHRAGDGRGADRSGRHQRLRPDHAGLRPPSGRSSTATGAPELYPEALRDEIDEVTELVYTDVNNGVYRCGFAGSQARTSGRIDRLFARLDWLERPAGRPALPGGRHHHRGRRPAVHHAGPLRRRSTTATSSATGSKLTEMPVLWAYARDLFQTPGFGDTDRLRPDQAALLRGAHRHQSRPRSCPRGPDLRGWLSPHGREQLGGRPFGDGTPPGPPPEDEVVPKTNGAAAG